MRIGVIPIAVLILGGQRQPPAPTAPTGEMTLALTIATAATAGGRSEIYLGFDNTSPVPYEVARVETLAADRIRIVHADGSRSAGFVIPANRFSLTGAGFPRLRLDGVRNRLTPGQTITVTLIGPHGRLNVEVQIREFAGDSAASPSTLRSKKPT